MELGRNNRWQQLLEFLCLEVCMQSSEFSIFEFGLWDQNMNARQFTQSKLAFWATHWDFMLRDKIHDSDSPPYPQQVILLRGRKIDCTVAPALESISSDLFIGKKAGKLYS